MDIVIKKEPSYLEVSKSKRRKYHNEIKTISRERRHRPHELQESCLGKEGRVLIGKTSGKRFTRFNIVAVQCGKKILAPMTCKEVRNTVLFLAWARQRLIPKLTRGQVVIIGNASFHKSKLIKVAIEEAGCKLIV